jgi:hypothetical protein
MSTRHTDRRPTWIRRRAALAAAVTALAIAAPAAQASAATPPAGPPTPGATVTGPTLTRDVFNGPTEIVSSPSSTDVEVVG